MSARAPPCHSERSENLQFALIRNDAGWNNRRPRLPEAIMTCLKVDRSMSRRHKALSRVLDYRATAAIRFDELRSVLRSLGFEERHSGSHCIFSRSDIAEIINLQPRTNGTAKPYQVRQVRRLILQYRLTPSAAEEP